MLLESVWDLAFAKSHICGIMSTDIIPRREKRECIVKRIPCAKRMITIPEESVAHREASTVCEAQDIMFRITMSSAG